MNSYLLLNEVFANSKDIRKNTKARRFLAFNKTENTFRVIPKLENLDKRLMLLVSPWLKDYYTFESITQHCFEIPHAFSEIIQGFENFKNFTPKFIFRDYLFELKIKSSKEIEISAKGFATEEDEFEYPNMWKILYSFDDEDVTENPDF